jgi:dienelactone hydrolase
VVIKANHLRELFGLAEPESRLISAKSRQEAGYVVEVLNFSAPGGEVVRGILTRPLRETRGPAILYAHAHGGAYEIGADELVDGRSALLSPLGPVLAQAGYVTLCIDMPTFGDRAAITESALSKARLWYGQSLFGQMLSEQAAALTYLASRPDVDPGRIGMFGISMGATLAYFLAAVDTRIAAIAHLCCFADFATLVETGDHDLHGIYLTIPGLLAATTTGEIAGLVAPRPQLICVGEADPLTPPLAVDRAWADTRTAYGDGQVELLREPGIGHQETETMRAAVLEFFRNTLAS